MCRYLIERFLDIRATENTAAMSMLDCPHHPTQIRLPVHQPTQHPISMPDD
jgi:hypothetical protein